MGGGSSIEMPEEGLTEGTLTLTKEHCETLEFFLDALLVARAVSLKPPYPKDVKENRVNLQAPISSTVSSTSSASSTATRAPWRSHPRRSGRRSTTAPSSAS